MENPAMDSPTDHLIAVQPAFEPDPNGELPMLVWLRGDEPIAAAFSLEAEAVMAKLGIRRSRLTQLCGKELRVGRVRRGRYVVPVFRPIDVEEYQAWSRAPATHIKSSNLLKEAADSLAERSSSILDQFELATDRWQATIDSRLAKLTGELLKQSSQEANTRRSDLERLRRDLSEQDGKRHAAESCWQARLNQLSEHMERQAAAGAVQARELAELAALIRLLRADADRRQAELQAQVESLQETPRLASPNPSRRAAVRALLARQRSAVTPSPRSGRTVAAVSLKPTARARVKAR